MIVKTRPIGFRNLSNHCRWSMRDKHRGLVVTSWWFSRGSLISLESIRLRTQSPGKLLLDDLPQSPRAINLAMVEIWHTIHPSYSKITSGLSLHNMSSRIGTYNIIQPAEKQVKDWNSSRQLNRFMWFEGCKLHHNHLNFYPAWSGQGSRHRRTCEGFHHIITYSHVSCFNPYYFSGWKPNPIAAGETPCLVNPVTAAQLSECYLLQSPIFMWQSCRLRGYLANSGYVTIKFQWSQP